jgi:lysozyme
LADQLLKKKSLASGKGIAMPWINGRFYMNPAYGRALERTRAAEAEREAEANHKRQRPRSVQLLPFVGDAGIPNGEPIPLARDSDSPGVELLDSESGPPQQQEDAHWVTIDHRHVLIHDTQEQHAKHAQNQMTLSSKGLDFIKRHEGFSGQVYPDSAGNPTIGYGHLIKPGENFDQGITQERAAALLRQDVQRAVGEVNAALEVPVTQNQFDALVSFDYNVGAKNLRNSTLLANLNSGKSVTKDNFTGYNHAGGRIAPGLTTRRTDEYNLFSGGQNGGR